MKLLFLDLETTGTDPVRNGIVQISGIIEIDGESREEFDFHLRPMPGKFFTYEALQVIGKTKEEILAFPDPVETYQKVVKLFEKYINRYNKRDKLHLVGQNPRFDYDFMTAFFNDNRNPYFYAYVKYHLIDLVALTAAFSLAGIVKTPDMKLKTIADYFGIKLDAHDSKEDIRATREIFYRYVELLKNLDRYKKACFSLYEDAFAYEPDSLNECFNFYLKERGVVDHGKN